MISRERLCLARPLAASARLNANTAALVALGCLAQYCFSALAVRMSACDGPTCNHETVAGFSPDVTVWIARLIDVSFRTLERLCRLRCNRNVEDLRQPSRDECEPQYVYRRLQERLRSCEMGAPQKRLDLVCSMTPPLLRES